MVKKLTSARSAFMARAKSPMFAMLAFAIAVLLVRAASVSTASASPRIPRGQAAQMTACGNA